MLSIVLIAGIVISMVGLAYAWGMPLIQKRTTITEFSTAESFVLNLDSKITAMANSGAGDVAIEIPNGRVVAVGYNDSDPGSKSLIIEFLTEQSMMLNTSVVLLETGSFESVGIYGESEPRIITMTNDKQGTKNLMKIRVHYRELDSASKGYRIAINPITYSGDSKVKLSFNRNEVIEGGARNGGDLVLTYIDVELI